ncbi:MAG: response regulator [Syntrophobacteraceae bacterium]|nr:response regulator [Syntrophobacteraceae bacterium]
MRRILFVDDEPMVLDGLRRTLRTMGKEWQMEYATSGREALEILAARVFDVLVTDMRMPGMDGCQLLNHVRELYPHTVRIILSGQSDKEELLKSIEPVHLYLSKPCDAEILKATLARTFAVRHLLENDSLAEVISKIQSLPSLPSLYYEIIDEIRSADGSLARVGDIISKDLGMSAKILQLVNSSFFGLATHISSPAKAVSLLGLETIKALVLGIKIFSGFSSSDLPCYSIATLWDHSLATACLAREIARHLNLTQDEIEDSFLAGLLHDIGKLILLDRLPEACGKIAEVASSTECPVSQAEKKVLGTTHGRIGAYLLGIWGFSESVVNAVAFHHCPGECPNDALSALTAVYLANQCQGKNDPGNINKTVNFDLDYLSKSGIDRIEELLLTCSDPCRLGENGGCEDSFRR